MPEGKVGKGNAVKGESGADVAAEAEVVEDDAIDDGPDREDAQNHGNAGEAAPTGEAVDDDQAEAAQQKTRRPAEGPAGQRTSQETIGADEACSGISLFS